MMHALKTTDFHQGNTQANAKKTVLKTSGKVKYQPNQKGWVESICITVLLVLILIFFQCFLSIDILLIFSKIIYY